MRHLLRPIFARVLFVAALVALAACGEDSDPPPRPGDAPPPEEPTARADTAPAGLVYERSVVFLSQDADSALAVPWSFDTRVEGGWIARARGAWFAREGGWEALALEADTTEAAPGEARRARQILPGRMVRLVVGPQDALETLVLRDPARPMETRFGLLLSEWTGTNGESVRFHRGTLDLPSAEHEGYLLDLSFAGDGAGGTTDWIFLHGGERLQALFAEASQGPEAHSSRYRGWTRLAVREARWPEVTVEWAEVRAFERARRDIPVRWRLLSPGDEILGELESVGSHLTAGEGEGPLLPVHALFQVKGEIRMEGETFEVTGVIRHRQR